MAQLQDDPGVLLERELADVLSVRAPDGATPETAFATLFGTAPPTWDVHPNAWPYGLSVVTDIKGQADLDQLMDVLGVLLPGKGEAAIISSRIARDRDGELWRTLAANKQWLKETTPAVLHRRRLH